MSRPRCSLACLRRDSRGITLVELLVAMFLLGTVGLLTTTAMIHANRVLQITDDETTGSADVQVASERLAQDVREARSVLCNPAGTVATLLLSDPSCARHLQLWIDYNSDYVQQPSETVTWQLINTDQPGHHDLIRIVNGSTMVQARTIVSLVAFSYDLPPAASAPGPSQPHTTSVNVNVTYDALLRGGTTVRSNSFSARLRNVR